MTTRTADISERIDDFIGAFNLGLRDQHMLEREADGEIVARFFNCRLSSVFQPIVDAGSSRVVGHEGLVRCYGGAGDAPISPWGVFALASTDADLVDLDRLCRTLHMLNHFRQAPPGVSLFLNVNLRLLTAVKRGFGQTFEERLKHVGLRPQGIVIELPAEIVLRQPLLHRAIADYQARGYRIAVSYRGRAEGWCTGLRHARPDIVKVAVGVLSRESDLAETIWAIRNGGAVPLAEKLETREQEERARNAGFDLLQGSRLGVPGAEVKATKRPNVALRTLAAKRLACIARGG